MTFIQRVIDFFSFSTRPVTVLTLVTYAVVLIASIWIHEGNLHAPKKPAKQLGLDLDAAWNDLQHVRDLERVASTFELCTQLERF